MITTIAPHRPHLPVLNWTFFFVVICAFAGRSTRAEDPKIIIHEDFESYTNVAAMNFVWPGGTAQLETLGPGRGKAASHDGSQMNNSPVFALSPDSSHDILLSGDFYDFATNTAKKVTLNLRNGSKLNLDIGMVNGNMFSVRAQGFCSKSDWIPIAGYQPPKPGWRRITATISLTNLHVTLSAANAAPLGIVNLPVRDVPLVFHQLRFGGVSGKPSPGGPVLVDNILLASVDNSSPASLVLAPFPEPLLLGVLPEAPPSTAAMVPAGIPEKKNPEPDVALNAPAPGRKYFESVSSLVWLIFGALALIIVLLTGLLLTIHRGNRANRKGQLALAAPDLTPQRLPSTDAGLPPPAHPEWRQRALTAEAVAAKQGQILKEKVGPHLVEFAKETLVQALYTQRNALLETQQRAEQALGDLESRLTALHLPQPQRIQEYEKRIAELEKQLVTRNDEMRELTHATLMLVRRRLEQEKLERPPDSQRFN